MTFWEKRKMQKTRKISLGLLFCKLVKALVTTLELWCNNSSVKPGRTLMSSFIRCTSFSMYFNVSVAKLERSRSTPATNNGGTEDKVMKQLSKGSCHESTQIRPYLHSVILSENAGYTNCKWNCLSYVDKLWHSLHVSN